MSTASVPLGSSTSEAEVTHISKHGIWLLLGDRELFMAFDHFREVLGTGGLRVVYDFEELFRAHDEYLKNPDLDAGKRQELRDKICGALDGEASARIAAFLFKKL